MSIVQILIDVVRAETATSVPFSMRPRLSFSRIEVALKNISFYSMSWQDNICFIHPVGCLGGVLVIGFVFRDSNPGICPSLMEFCGTYFFDKCDASCGTVVFSLRWLHRNTE